MTDKDKKKTFVAKVVSSPSAQQKGGKKVNLPSPFQQGGIPVFLQQRQQGPVEKIPNASLIYGVGAAVLFGVGLFFLFSGNWGTGLLIFIPAAALVGYAVHFMRFS